MDYHLYTFECECPPHLEGDGLKHGDGCQDTSNIVPVCIDAVGWKNTFQLDCEAYELTGYCANGDFIHAWEFLGKFSDFLLGSAVFLNFVFNLNSKTNTKKVSDVRKSNTYCSKTSHRELFVR